MSYSFGVRAATREALKAKVKEELDKVVAQQSCHALDREQAEKVAGAFIDLLPEAKETEVYGMSLSGSVMGKWEGNTVVEVSGVSVSANAYLTAKEAS